MSKRAARTFDSVRARKAPVIDLDEIRMNLLFHRLFTSGDGEYAIEYLRQLTKVAIPATASDSALWMAEGQRQLVARIEGMILDGERARTG